MFDLLGAGLGLLGGIFGGDEEQTQTRSMDPRMDKFVYGANGNGGLLGTAYNLMNQQLATGGLNDLQQRGLNMQAQYLQSPQYTNSYNNMASLGQQLMGSGIAGNPFTQSVRQPMGMQGMGAQRPVQMAPQGYQPYAPQMNFQGITPQIVQTDKQPTETDIAALFDMYMKKYQLGPYAPGVEDRFGSGDGFGGGMGGGDSSGSDGPSGEA